MKKVIDFIRRYDMIITGDKVIAGISGGADSVCLFFVLLELKKEIGIELIAVHVNHGLRGEAADRDEEFVRNLCREYQVPLEVFAVNVESIAKKRKQSLEEAGRIVRREAFETTCRKYGGTKIALAHHQNDNAETLLMNLARGTGLKGLGGIRPVNGKFIRPLLCLSRGEIEAFLAEKNQEFCTDATNADTEYTRNRLRHLVIPVLEQQVNSQAVRHMNETMEYMREIQDYMEVQTQILYDKCVSRTGDSACLIHKSGLENHPDILKKMVIRRCMEEISGQIQDLGHIHIQAVLELFQKQPGRKLDLPYSLNAVRGYEGVRISKAEMMRDRRKGEGAEHIGRAVSKVQESGGDFAPVELKIPGETRVPEKNLTICCNIFPKSDKFLADDIPQNIYTKWFDYDIIKRSLLIRTRQCGDSITIDKAGHKQKLKAWFINEKIPADMRASKLLIADGSQIVWIPGHRMSSAYQISGKTRQILQIKIVTEEKKDGRDNSGFGIREGS